MEDPVYQATKDLKVWRVSLDGRMANRFRDEIVSSAAARNIDVLVLSGDMVFGADHLRAALYHAKKALQEKRNASESLAMETLLYASGERQLSSAIKKMAIEPTTKEIVVAQLSKGELDPSESWKQEEPVREGVHDSEFIKFGLPTERLSDVEPKRRIDLILELVAAVDVLKK